MEHDETILFKVVIYTLDIVLEVVMDYRSHPIVCVIIYNVNIHWQSFYPINLFFLVKLGNKFCQFKKCPLRLQNPGSG